MSRQVVKFAKPVWIKCPVCQVIFDYNQAQADRSRLYGRRITAQEVEHFGNFCTTCKPL